MHVMIIVQSFFMVRLLKSSEGGLVKAGILLLLLVITLAIIYGLVKLAVLSKSMADESRVFIYSLEPNKTGDRPLAKARIRSYRPFVFSIACSLPLDKATLASIMHEFTLNGLMTLLLSYD